MTSAHTQYLIGFGERGLLEKGSFQKSPFRGVSREFRDSREPPDCAIFLPQKIIFILEISEVIFKDHPKIPIKTSMKRTSRGYLLFLEVFFFASRGYFLRIASKDS